MVLRLVRCVTAVLDVLYSDSKQSSTKSSEFHPLHLPLGRGSLNPYRSYFSI